MHLYRGITKDKPHRWVYGSLIHREKDVAINKDEYAAIVIFDQNAASLYNEYLELEVLPETVGMAVNWLFGETIYQHDYDCDGNMLSWCDRCLGWQFFTIDIETRDVIFCNNCDGNFMVQDHIPGFIVTGTIHDHLLTK